MCCQSSITIKKGLLSVSQCSLAKTLLTVTVALNFLFLFLTSCSGTGESSIQENCPSVGEAARREAGRDAIRFGEVT